MEIKYRPEIDGLRTIAVLSVIIYHAEFAMGSGKLLPGGFFGVDIFFVISGFLITSLMMSEFYRTGTISIKNFYERRARRLLPALIVVMLVSIPFAWMYLLPDQLVDYAKSLISSLLFGSNLYWNYSLQQYGAESALLKPFLHTWSLAVEEQYYIVFPLILLAILKWFKHHAIVLLTAGLLVSLQFAEWMTQQDASFSFYMLPSRFWELLAGGLLANILHLHPQKDNDALLNKTMPVLGLFLIVYSVIFIDLDSNHPGFVTLVPVVGTILIIWFANKNDLITQVLSSTPFVAIGLISYSLYLWHYPVFAFARVAFGDLSLYQKMVCIFLSLILSLVSFRFVEKPFRENKCPSVNKWLMVSLVFPLFFVSGFSVAFIQQDGYQGRIENLFSKEAKHTNQKTLLAWLDNTVNHSNFESESYFSGQYKEKVLVLGDSHVTAWGDAINSIYKRDDNVIVTLSYLGCGWKVVGDSVVNRGPNLKKHDKRCNATKDLLNDEKVSSSFDTIVLASYRPFSSKVNMFRFDLLKLLKKRNPNANVVIVGNYYQLTKGKVGCLGLMQQKMDNASICITHSDYPPVNYDHKEDVFFDEFDGLGYVYFDLIDNVCGEGLDGKCPYEYDGIPFMLDWNHMTPLFTRHITKQMLDRGVNLLDQGKRIK
ncbi:MAG: acyltransferase family protein [Motiliproteus sp.]